jgi:type I restriction enzyme S subunit
MSDWRRGTIGELAKGHRGVSYAAGQLRQFKSPETVTLLRSNNISSGRLNFEDVQIVPCRLVSEEQLLRTGDIAVCMSNGSKALVGKAAPFLGSEVENFTVGAFCSIFRPIDASTAAFVSFIFQSKEYRKSLDLALAGTAINNLRNADLEAFGCDIPPPDEQPKIAQILDTLDTAIHQTETIIAKLKAVKQGLLHDLLTRGIDANGELRPPQAEAPHLYKQSPLGWIPKEWDVAPTSTRCTLITKGTTPAGCDMWQDSEGIRFLRVDNLSFDGRFDLEASTFRVSVATHNGYLARSKCQPGDVLMNIVGPPLGKLGLVTEESGEININQAIALFRPTEKLVSRFLLIWLSSSISKAWLRKRAKQTSGQVNLTLALCQELPLPCISITEQQAIVNSVLAAKERIFFEEAQLEKMQFEKSGLMDDLLTGRVRVTPLLEMSSVQQTLGQTGA